MMHQRVTSRGRTRQDFKMGSASPDRRLSAFGPISQEHGRQLTGLPTPRVASLRSRAAFAPRVITPRLQQPGHSPFYRHTPATIQLFTTRNTEAVASYASYYCAVTDRCPPRPPPVAQIGSLHAQQVAKARRRRFHFPPRQRRCRYSRASRAIADAAKRRRRALSPQLMRAHDDGFSGISRQQPYRRRHRPASARMAKRCSQPHIFMISRQRRFTAIMNSRLRCKTRLSNGTP